MAVGKGSMIRVSNASKKKDIEEELPEEVNYSQPASVMAKVPFRYLSTVPQSWGFSAYSEDEIASVMGSIEQYGLLEPLFVWRQGEQQFVVLNGSRRMEAIQRLQMEEVPVYILDTSEVQAKEIYMEMRRFALIKQNIRSYKVVSSIRSDLPAYLL